MKRSDFNTYREWKMYYNKQWRAKNPEKVVGYNRKNRKPKPIVPADDYFDEVLQLICNHFKLDINLVKSPCRFAEVVNCRNIFAYFCFRYLRYSNAQIGKAILRNRTTINHSIEKVINEIELYGSHLEDLKIIKKNYENIRFKNW